MVRRAGLKFIWAYLTLSRLQFFRCSQDPRESDERNLLDLLETSQSMRTRGSNFIEKTFLAEPHVPQTSQ
jgi:hypothetical protein